MTVRHILAETARAFEAAGVPDPALDAQLLLAEALSEPRLSLLIRQERVLTAEEEGRFRAMARRRLAREPLQYILGRAWFYGLPLRVGPGVLIPRADTESVCQMALDALDPKRACAVLDLCTGSGALALAIKRERPLCLVTATDLSPEALACARLNARENGLDVEFASGDLWESVPGRSFGLVVSNPPYIPDGDLPFLQEEVRREPVMALRGGKDGMDFYRRILRGLPDHLDPGGALCLECADTQVPPLEGLLRDRFDTVLPFNDLNGHPRGVLGKGYHDRKPV